MVLKRAAAGLSIAGALVLALGWQADRNTDEFLQTKQAVAHTYKVIDQLQETRKDVGRAVSSTWAYIISGDATRLEVYHTSVRSLPERIARLRQLTSDNPAQQQRVDELEKEIQTSFEALAQSQAIFSVRGFQAAREHLLNSGTLDIMEKIDRAEGNLRGSEQRLLVARDDRLESRARRSNIISVAAIGIACGLLVMVYLSIRSYIAERRRTIQLVETQNAELEERNRTAERATRLKSEFLANMSHELRTPLNAILGFSELLEQDATAQLSGKHQRWVQHIRTAGNHLLQLINDILDLSKIEAGRMDLRLEEFRMASAIPEVLSVIGPSAMMKKIQISTSVPEEIEVCADRVRLKQVIYNLLSNAVKFTPELGSVRLECRAQDDVAILTVCDTGVGIRQEDQAIIFQEFRQAGKNAGGVKEGTGLGLTISRRLVELQGGRIWVESVLGNGSTFGFTIPLAKTCVRNEIVLPESVEQRTRPLVLVVEDEPATQELLKTFLHGENLDVLTASSAEEAITLVRLHSPDVITLDILMPAKTGWELLYDLKRDKETASLPVIVVSVLDRKELGFILGASDYLVKPVTREALLSAISRNIKMKPGTGPILVADDNPQDLRNMMEVVTAAGYVPVAASTGLEVLQWIQRIRPQAVILDLVMPDMDGFETLRNLRATPQFESLPVLVLTARELSGEESELLLRHANACFHKGPGWKNELLGRIRAAVERDSQDAVITS